ncbi:glycosyltransferase [Enterococcus hailinensis]|uniref:glycosyltransferase n=1 Tax=Enterococcus hailinensis TaxID=3238988 RepID=UPI0038B257DA
MKKKVCFVNDDFSLGGIQKVNVYLGEELVLNKQDVYFYASAINPKNFYKIEISKLYLAKYTIMNNLDNILHKIQRKIIKNLNREFTLKKNDVVVKKLISFLKEKNIDTVVLNGPIFISYIPFIKEAIPTIKCIGWLHNSYKVYLGNDKNSYTRFFRKSFLKGLAVSDQNVCLTHEDLSAYQKFNKKTVCIYNPVTMKVKGKADLNKKNISFLSRVAVQHKGLDYLAEISSMLPKEWTIKFGGNGNKKENETFNNYIEKYNSKKNIDLLGALDEFGVKKVFENSSIYLMTSRWEGMPLVLAEAMSFGLPIIAFDQTGSREVLGNGKYGIIVEQGNINEMNSQLKRLISSKELREEFSKKSLIRINDFNIELIARKWLEII